MTEWQPMESAPRIKGSRVLVWDGTRVETVEYEPAYKHPPHIKHPESWNQISDSGRATQFQPIRWMPLPEPPK